MSRSEKTRWLNAGAAAVAAVLFLETDRGWPGYVGPGLLILLGMWLSPLPDRIGWRSAATQEEVDALLSEQPDRVVVYRRPGCVFCARLRLGLVGVARRATWVDIWADDAAAGYVRSVADGNETVPTVVVDGEARVNPPVSVVRRALSV